MPLNIIRHTFTDGMNQDALDSLNPSSTYKLALNALHESDEHSNFGLVNEKSNRKVAEFSGQIVGSSFIDEWNQTLVFVDNEGVSELHLYNHYKETTTFVCSDAEFGCTWDFDTCEFLYGEFKHFNSCEDLFVYFSSGCNYYVVNISEMLDPVRKSVVTRTEDCIYFRLFNCICGPKLSATPVKYTGSSFEGGAICFAIQLEDEDLNQTNWFNLSQTVYISTEDNIPGQPATSAVRLNIDYLDTRYSRVNIVVIKTVGGVTTAEKLPALSYGSDGLTYEYYGQKGEPINLAEITTPTKAYLKGQDLIQKDGRLFFYNLKNEKNLNYQKYANQIQVGLVEYEVTMEQNLKYNFPSLLRGETYAPAIVWNYCDGTHSHAFHIRGIDRNGGTGGGQSESSQALAVDIGENPNGELDQSNFNTSQQFDRRRNPSTQESHSDPLQDAMSDDIDNVDSNEQNLKDAAACHDTLYGCDTAGTTFNQDLDDYSNVIQNQAEYLAEMTQLDSDPSEVILNKNQSLKEAAQELMKRGVVNREYVTRKRPTLNFSDNAPTASGSTVSRTVVPSGQSVSYRGDNWIDGDGNSLTEEPPRVTWRGFPDVYESSLEYPNTLDCDGNRYYPEGNITFPKTPPASVRPHFVSYQNGVVNQYQPENYEYGNCYARLLGFNFDNIYIPTEDELPKPLCENNPFSIVYVKRTDQNKSVFAKGWFSGMFQGEVYGQIYNFPRHGVNSFEHVDRYVHAGLDGTSRLGVQTPDNTAYTFHSPDTDCDQSFLPVTHIRSELALRGSGWRHGLYARGRNIIDDQWAGTRKDQAGARVSNNLNHYTGTFPLLNPITGITYAEADKVISPPGGIDRPLMNRSRERSVYLQTERKIFGDTIDKSFVGDVLDHYAPTSCRAPYGALVRDLPDQYGTVDGLSYIPLGLNATEAHVRMSTPGGTTQIEGICGDIFIVPYSKKRTSYVSNKVGDTFNPPPKPLSNCRERSICESPDDAVFEVLGINHYPSRLPKSGDIHDPKNYAGLHTVAGECGDLGTSRNSADAALVGESETDFYYPKVLKSLVHIVVESHVNTDYLQTGQGSQVQTGQVFYPRLKDLYLDSAAPAQHPWEESFLNRYYSAIEQPSLKQLFKKMMIRTFLNVIVPILGLLRFDNLEAIVDTTGAMVTMPMLIAMWTYANQTLFTDRKLNQLLGIGDCRTDSEGGDLDESIENWEDVYCRYNWDYSKKTDEKLFTSPPVNYNTCDCDDCSSGERMGTGRQLNNEIYHSSKQNLDSEIDAYKNVKIHSYNEMPAHAGHLKKLFLQGQGMYAHTSEGIWAIKMAEGNFPINIGSQITGSGELIAEPILMFEGSQEGFMGTHHPNAAINVGGWGYFFIDEVARKIYRFNGQPEEISAYGMRNFFQKHLPFCEEADCWDEKKDGIYYSLGWDNRHNRLLVTKKDANDNASYTLSYTPIGAGSDGRGKWVSFHSYLPNGYIWDRGQMFSYADGEIWKHHDTETFQEFYGEKYPFMVDFSVNDASTLRGFNFRSAVLTTEAKQFVKDVYCYSNNLDITFNQLAVYNDGQSTGLLPVKWVSDDYDERNNVLERISDNYSQIRLHKEDGVWNFSEVHNNIESACAKPICVLTKKDKCQAIPEINNSIISCKPLSEQDIYGRRFTGRSLNFRLVFDVYNNTELKLLVLDVIEDTEAAEKSPM